MSLKETCVAYSMPIGKRAKSINVRLTSEEFDWLLTHSPNVSQGVRLLILDGMRREGKCTSTISGA